MNRLCSGLLAVLAALLILAPGAHAQTARDQLERFSEGLESLHASFTQTVVSDDGRLQDQSGGQVWLMRPNRFRWSYGGDFPELVVADGARVWIYDEMLEQVTVRNQADAAIDSPLALLTDPDGLDDHFEVREVGATDEASLLELRSLGGDAEFERFLLGMSEDSVVLIIMEDAFGLRTEIRFSSVRRNPVLDPALFEFSPPEGVDVIGALPGPGQAR